MASKDAIISLRVFIQSTGTTKTMRFGAEMSIQEVLREVAEKGNVEGGKDHGLFCPPNKEAGKKGYWLAKNRALRYYGIQSNALLEYKKRHRPMRIRLADDTQKTVIINDASTVREISNQIGEKLGIKSVEEFALRKLSPPDHPPGAQHIWLNEQQTLHEQDVAEDMELGYSQKYYFSDPDKDSPTTLHLLYVEAQRAILDGRYPVTRTDAKDFAAIQMQIVYGDHDVSKHKPGFFELDKFVPAAFRKDKGIADDILKDHKKLTGMKEMTAKYRYVQLCRSLKTYGITFFDAKEKSPNQKKMNTVLIGITKDKILKVDPETMRPVREWSLEQMRRWASQQTSFTLDFGDSADDYLNLVTDHGEAMSGLIAGYIDIILRTRTDQDRHVRDDDDDIAEEEMMTGQFGIANIGMTSSFSSPYGQGAGQAAMMDPGVGGHTAYPGPSTPGSVGIPPSKRVNVVDIPSAVKMTRLLGTELAAAKGRFGAPGKLTEEEWRKQFNAHRDKIDGMVSDLIAQGRLGPGALKRGELDGKAKELAMELNNLATAARNLAALSDENAPLVDGAKAMADTVADLLELMLRAVDEPNPAGFVPSLDAAGKQMVAAKLLTSDPKLTSYADKGAELLMLQCLTDIDLNMADLLGTASAASDALPAGKREQLKDEAEKVKAVKGFAMHTLRNLVPQVMDPLVAEQVQGAHATLLNLTAELVGKAKFLGVPGDYGPRLVDAQDRVKLALTNLLEATRVAEERGIEGNLDILEPTQEFLSSLADIRGHIDDAEAVIQGVRAAAVAQNKIITVAKALAAGADEQTKQRLQNASSNLSQGVKDLMQEARLLGRDPSDLQLQGKVIAVVGKLEGQAQEIITDAGAMTALNNLRFSSKTTAATMIRLATAAQLAGVSDGAARADLLAASKRVQSSLAGLLSALQSAAKNPDDVTAQSALAAAAGQAAPVYHELADKSKRAAKFVASPEKQADMTMASDEAAENLRQLLKAIESVGSLSTESDIESALAEFDAVKADLETAEFYAHQGMLTPIPGQTRESALALLKLATDTMGKAAEDLAASAKRGTPLPEPVKQGASGMAQIATAARTMASTIADRQTQKKIVGAAKELCDDTLNLIALSRALTLDRANPHKTDAVAKSRQAFAATLGSLLAAATGLDSKDITKAMEDIQAARGAIRKDAPTRMVYKDASDSLQGSGKALTAAVNQIAAVAANNPMLLGSAAKMTGATTQQLLIMVSNAASSAPDTATADAILAAARSLADAMGGLLASARLTATKKSPQTLQQLKETADKAQQSIGELINSLGNATSPEAEQAIHRIMATLTALDAGQLDVIPGSREDLLNEFLQAAKDMARVSGSLVTSARVSASKMGLFAKEAASTVKTLITTAKAASLADGSGAQMSLDAARIVKGAEFIVENPEDSKRVMGCAKKITQAGAKLIANAKEHAKAEPDRQRRADVVKHAQLVVNGATALAAAARDAASKTPAAVQKLLKTAQDLRDWTIALDQSMRSAQTPEQLAEEAIDPAVASQLMSTVRTIALETTGLIRSSANVSSNPEEKSASEELKRSNRSVTEALQQLLKVTGSLNPGIQECERAIQSTQTASAELDAASISASVGNLHVPGADAAPYPAYQQATSAVCKQLADALKGVVAAAGGASKELVAAAQAVAGVIPDLVQKAKLTAGATADREAQASVLGSAKDVADQIVATLRAVIEANVNDKESFIALQRSAGQASEAIGNLLGQLQSGQQLHQDLDRTVQAIKAAIEGMAQPAQATKSYADCRDELAVTAREFASAASTLANVDKRNLGQVNLAATRAGELIAALAQQARLCMAATKDAAAKQELFAQTKALAVATVGMLAQTKALTAGQNAQPQLRQAFANTNAAVAALLAAAKKGAVGEALMDGAVETITAAVGKLNAASVFAQAGQLEPDRTAAALPMGQMQQHLAAAASKVGQTSAAVGRAAGGASDEQLGGAAQELSAAVKSVADISAAAASRLPDALAQQDVLAAAKFLAISSHQLILAAKDAQRLPGDNTAQQTFAASQQAVSESAQRLVQAIQQSSAETARAEKELEETKQAILGLLQSVQAMKGAGAEEVLGAVREVLQATSEMAFAQNQTDALAAGKASIAAVELLLSAAKGATALTQDPNVIKGITQAAGGIARSVVDLIEVGKLSRQDPATQGRLEQASEKVAASANAIVLALRKLPNAEHITLQEAGIDLDQKAEQELLKCAKIIEEAAKLLLAAKPKEKTPGMIEKMDINDAILDAATAIARATGQLVMAASVAQRERTQDKGRPGAKYQNDPTWANGLISAAQQVSGAVQALVESANSAAQGGGSEEALVASARGVASATAHLVAAAKAKADPNSQAQRALATAAKSVANATSQLVTTAAQFGAGEEEAEEEAAVNFSTAGGKAKELEQQMRILRLEKELEMERVRMAGIRKAKYTKK